MARRPRLQIPGAVYHVMSRGNRKDRIFEDDADRERFDRTVRDAARRYAIRCYAACLMNNHYHLVLDAPRVNLSDAMRYVNGVFSRTSNRRHHRTGHLFEARFRSIVVERKSYLRRVARYVVLNPVRAHLVSKVESWPWSTYRATVGLEEVPEWLYLDWLTTAFKVDSIEEARERYGRYVNSPAPSKSQRMSALAVGSKSFEKAVRDAALARHAEDVLPRAITALGRPSLEALFTATYPVGPERDRIIALAHSQYGYRLAEISRHLGCHRSTASAALRRLEIRSREGAFSETSAAS
jgi:putative transposase